MVTSPVKPEMVALPSSPVVTVCSSPPLTVYLTVAPAIGAVVLSVKVITTTPFSLELMSTKVSAGTGLSLVAFK